MKSGAEAGEAGDVGYFLGWEGAKFDCSDLYFAESAVSFGMRDFRSDAARTANAEEPRFFGDLTGSRIGAG